MTEKQIATMKKVGKVVLFIIGAPIIVPALVIGMMVAIYGTLFAGIVNLIRNHGGIKDNTRAEREADMVPQIAR